MTEMPHTAMVLAAGLGTRMRPLTEDTAKPLLEVSGRSLIDRALDDLVAAGVRRAVVNVHWCADKVEAHLQRRTDIEVFFSDERGELLDTGGGLAKARPHLGNDPVFVVNTDAFWMPAGPEPLHRMAETFDPNEMDVLLLLADRSACLGFPGPGDMFRNDDGRLTRRGDAPTAPWAYAGVRITKPQLYEKDLVKPFSVLPKWDAMISKGRLFGLGLDRFWLHVGTPEALNEAEAWIRINQK
ncbi:MAG: nucleotidyltransferase family protein [Pseudomonadota bacterium]